MSSLSLTARQLLLYKQPKPDDGQQISEVLIFSSISVNVVSLYERELPYASHVTWWGSVI